MKEEQRRHMAAWHAEQLPERNDETTATSGEDANFSIGDDNHRDNIET